MKKAVSITMVLAILFGMATALAAGTQADPLISKSYVEGTYRAALGRIADTAIENAKIPGRISTLKEKTGFQTQPGAESKTFSTPSKISLAPGTTFTLTSGTAAIKNTGGGKILNISKGTIVSPGTALALNQRYFCGDETAAYVETTSASAAGYIDGYNKIEPLSGWIITDGKTYYYNNGTKQTGWLTLGGKQYYLNTDGSMATVEITLGNTTYYFDPGGALAGQQSVSSGPGSSPAGGGDVINAQTSGGGWVKQGSSWYFLDSSGRKMTGWIEDGSKKYYLSSNGAMQTGWLKTGGKWYFLGTNGVRQNGWVLSGGRWYYLSPSNGAMQTGWLKHNNKWYYLNPSGAMETGWIKLGNGVWYFLDSGGAMVTGWLKQGSIWYYLKPSGAMAVNEKLTISGKVYNFNASGRCTNP